MESECTNLHGGTSFLSRHLFPQSCGQPNVSHYKTTQLFDTPLLAYNNSRLLYDTPPKNCLNSAVIDNKFMVKSFQNLPLINPPNFFFVHSSALLVPIPSHHPPSLYPSMSLSPRLCRHWSVLVGDMLFSSWFRVNHSPWTRSSHHMAILSLSLLRPTPYANFSFLVYCCRNGHFTARNRPFTPLLSTATAQPHSP